MTTAQQWLQGARPRTLPLAIAPILGAGAAVCGEATSTPHALWWLMCAAVALLLQIGVNYANDYSDGIRGTDAERIKTGGPIRLVGQGLAEPRLVKRAALLSFLAAAVVGAALVGLTGAWWLLGVGGLAIPAAWFYTGGSRPYGYAGLGEVFVFIFFGLAAVLGTTFVQLGSLPGSAWLIAIGEGLLAASVLMVNNIRDIATDVDNGKRTLAVRLGERASRIAFVVMVSVGFAVAGLAALGFGTRWLVLAVLLPITAIALRPHGVLGDARGPQLVKVLVRTSRNTLIFSILLLLLALIGRH